MSLVALLSMLCGFLDSWVFMLYKHTGLMFNDNDLIFCLLVWYCCFGIVWTVRQAVPVNDIKCKLRWCKPLHASFSSGPLLLNSDQISWKHRPPNWGDITDLTENQLSCFENQTRVTRPPKVILHWPIWISQMEPVLGELMLSSPSWFT